MSDDRYTLEDILAPGWFDERITDVGSKQDFIDWYNSTVYHKFKDHEFDVVDRFLKRYERHRSNVQGYLNLAQIETEYPELYAPNDDTLYVFLPDACGESAFRLSVFSMSGTILTHKEFNDRESALRYAAKQGCTEERPGAMDSLIGTEGMERSLVTYAAQQANTTLDDYIMKSKDRATRLLFRDRINFLTNLQRNSADTGLSM